MDCVLGLMHEESVTTSRSDASTDSRLRRGPGVGFNGAVGGGGDLTDDYAAAGGVVEGEHKGVTH